MAMVSDFLPPEKRGGPVAIFITMVQMGKKRTPARSKYHLLKMLCLSRSCFWPHNRRRAAFVLSLSFCSLISCCQGYVVEAKDWRWTQWVILFGLAVAITMTLFMSESYKSVLLKKRAKKLGIKPPQPKPSVYDNLKYFVTKTITRPMYMMVTEPIVTLFDIYNAFNFGLLNAFFAAFSWVYASPRMYFGS